MMVVSDTSPLTNFMKIGELDLLRQVFGGIVIPPAVHKELAHLQEQATLLAQNSWIEVVELADKTTYQQLLSEVHAGEAEAMALALEVEADYLLIDEQAVRMVAHRYGLRVTGLIGVLILVKQQGVITAIKPYLQQLIYEADFYISKALFQKVVKSVGE